jgi:signal transduction histidine kinase
VITTFQKKLLRVGKILSGIALVVGVLSFSGWVLQIDELKTLLLSSAKVKLNTSILIIISGLVIFFNYPKSKKASVLRLAFTILFLVGILTILEHIFQIDLGIDFLLPRSVIANNSDLPSIRMTALSAINFCLLGLIFLAYSFKKYFAAQILAVLILISIYAVLLAYCFNINSYYDFGKYSAISFPTAAAIFLLALSTLFYQPSKGLMEIVTGARAGSRIIRYIYVYSLLFIPIQVALYLFLIRQYSFTPEVVILSVLVISMAVSFPLTLFLIYKINSLDLERSSLACQLEKTNRDLVDANYELQSIVEEYTVSTEALSVTTEKLNASNDALLKSNEKLQNLHIELAQMVADRTADLEYTLIELQERNQELDQYVYKVSHDIRSPVASITGVLNLIKMEEPPVKIRHYLDMVENRISKLDDFIRSVLSHSKSLNAPFVSEPIDFTKLIRECWEELEFEEGWSMVQLNILSPPPDFKGDQTRLEIVFKNLLANGVRYRNQKADGFINISFQSTPETITMNISDNGIGIEEEYLEKVFQMFYRATEASEGSGLGLYIVKQVVDKMEGEIFIKSKICKGTCISITLPRIARESE